MITPWGESEHEEEIAEGITFYGTAGHGGYHLSMRRLTEMHPSLRKKPHAAHGYPGTRFCGIQWFEEDCEAALVALAFRHESFMVNARGAEEGVKAVYPAAYADWKKSQKAA